MGGEKNRGAPCNHALEHSLQSARGDGIHGFEWLVEEENLRPVDHRCGQRELFLHSVRVVGNEFLRLVRQLHELEQFSCPLRCRLAVKAVSGLGLESRRSGPCHPGAVAFDHTPELFLARGPGRLDRGQDPAARGMELFIARSRRAQRELLHPVAGKACVRVTVDEPRDGAEAAPVQLDDVSRRQVEVDHLARRHDAAVFAENEGVLEHAHVSKRRAAERRMRAGRGRELREVAHQETTRCAVVCARSAHAPPEGGMGCSRPCCSAASSASR